jgi:hypothetical protein
MEKEKCQWGVEINAESYIKRLKNKWKNRLKEIRQAKRLSLKKVNKNVLSNPKFLVLYSTEPLYKKISPRIPHFTSYPCFSRQL